MTASCCVRQSDKVEYKQSGLLRVADLVDMVMLGADGKTTPRNS